MTKAATMQDSVVASHPVRCDPRFGSMCLQMADKVTKGEVAATRQNSAVALVRHCSTVSFNCVKKPGKEDRPRGELRIRRRDELLSLSNVPTLWSESAQQNPGKGSERPGQRGGEGRLIESVVTCCNTCKSAHRNLGPSCFEFLPTVFSRESCENPFERKFSRNPLRNPSRKPSIPKTCFECPSSRKSCPGPWLAEFQKKDAPRA